MNASVHHEMIAPLKGNIEILTRLITKLKDRKLAQMGKTVLTTMQMLMLHANDLLDHQIIENGAFVPVFTKGSVNTCIEEIVCIFDLTLENRKLNINFVRADVPTLKFDKR